LLICISREFYPDKIPLQGRNIDIHLSNEHYRARCIKCSRVFDVDMEFIVGLERNIKDTRGFEFIGHDIIFKGVCLECNI